MGHSLCLGRKSPAPCGKTLSPNCGCRRFSQATHRSSCPARVLQHIIIHREPRYHILFQHMGSPLLELHAPMGIDAIADTDNHVEVIIGHGISLAVRNNIICPLSIIILAIDFPIAGFVASYSLHKSLLFQRTDDFPYGTVGHAYLCSYGGSCDTWIFQ